MKKSRKILFTSHTANFQKFNRPFMRMLRGTLEEPYSDLNIGGWTVDYASANEETILDADNIFRVDFSRNPFAFRKHLLAYRQLKSILENNHYDIIHTHTPVGSVITRLAAKKCRKHGTKVIYTSHGFHFFNGAPLKYWCLFYPIEKLCAKYTDLLITINREDYGRAKAKFNTAVRMINGVGVDTTKFNQSISVAEKNNIRKKLGFKKNDYIIVYVAEFIARKNHRFLLESIAPLLKEKPDIKIALLGKGELLLKTKQLAKDLGIEKQVSFLGYRDDVYRVLQSCNLAVSTSLSEGLGLGVIEAQLCGLPIIISDNRGHREIADKHKKNIFSPKDKTDFKNKIAAAYGGEDFYINFNEKFSLRSSLKKMRKIYLDY